MKTPLLSAFLICSLTAAVQAHAAAPQPVANNFNVTKYMGTWYEIARFREVTEAACDNSLATYTQLTDGSNNIQVLNQCDRLGTHSRFESLARAPNPKEPARLTLDAKVAGQEVHAPYNVLVVDEGYKWALVGTPDHDHLWVLSREPYIDTKVLAGLVKRAEKEFGYSKVQERLNCTKQPKGANIACEDVLRSQT